MFPMVCVLCMYDDVEAKKRKESRGLTCPLRLVGTRVRGGGSPALLAAPSGVSDEERRTTEKERKEERDGAR